MELAEKVETTLVKAKAALSDPKSWTKGEFARDDLGDACMPEDGAAQCWCSLGAIHKGSYSFRNAGINLTVAEWASSTLKAAIRNEPIPTHLPSFGAETQRVDMEVIEWNDNEARTHEEVLTAFDRAIEMVRGVK